MPVYHFLRCVLPNWLVARGYVGRGSYVEEREFRSGRANNNLLYLHQSPQYGGPRIPNQDNSLVGAQASTSPDRGIRTLENMLLQRKAFQEELSPGSWRTHTQRGARRDMESRLIRRREAWAYTIGGSPKNLSFRRRLFCNLSEDPFPCKNNTYCHTRPP